MNEIGNTKDNNDKVGTNYPADINQKLKKQDLQLKKMNEAIELEKQGFFEKAIVILEEVFYKEGLLVHGTTWPMLLPKIYIKNKMNDKCWAYLNYIYDKGWMTFDRIRDLQATILKNEGKHNDALKMKMIALLWKYTSMRYKPEILVIEKQLNPYIKKAGKTNQTKSLLEIFEEFVSMKKFDESKFSEKYLSIK